MPAPFDAQSRQVHVPRFPRTPIRRERLLAELDYALEGSLAVPVVLLCAPVGAGKTMLLADWVDRLGSRPARDQPTIAWLTVEEGDNDPATLRVSLRAALDNASGPNAAQASRALSASRGDPGGTVTTAPGSVDHQTWLVIDDAHLIHETGSLSALARFIATASPNLRTIISGRHEPPLTLHRLRLEGKVHEIAHRRLDFTRDEAAQLLAEHGVDLSESDLSTLMTRTEGWAAGIRLAGIMLSGLANPSRLISEFGGSNRAVADYLVNEVLSGYSADVREFLAKTSIPSSFTLELAEHLTGNPFAQRILRSLERDNALLSRVDDDQSWYRYHPLLRGYLRAELRGLGADTVRELDRAASTWFARAGKHLRALTHIVDADDAAGIVTLVDETGLSLVLAGYGARLNALLERSPRCARDHPSVRLVRAAAELAAGEAAAAQSMIDALDRENDAARDEPQGYVTDATGRHSHLVLRETLRVQAAIESGGVATALHRLRHSDPGHSGNPELDAFALLHEGIAELYLGDLTAAERHLQQALSHSRAARASGMAVYGLAGLTAVSAVRSDFTECQRRADRAATYARTHLLSGNSFHVVAALLAAWSRTQQPCDAGALHATPPRIAKSRNPVVNRVAAILSTLIEFDTAEDKHGTLAALREQPRDTGEERPAPLGVTAMTTPPLQRACLEVGENGWAQSVLEDAERDLGPCGEVSLMTAVMQLHHRRLDAAGQSLAPVLSGELPCITPVNLIRAWILEFLIAHDRDRSPRAHDALLHAMSLASPERIVRPFHDGGTRMHEVLTRDRGRFGVYENFAETVLRTIPAATQSLTDLLTPRELDLVKELPSWRTADQIAAELCVSVNTVKTHLRGIYRKLNVNNRRDAIAAARAHGLL